MKKKKEWPLQKFATYKSDYLISLFDFQLRIDSNFEYH